jgi:hypothetical protein
VFVSLPLRRGVVLAVAEATVTLLSSGACFSKSGFDRCGEVFEKPLLIHTSVLLLMGIKLQTYTWEVFGVKVVAAALSCVALLSAGRGVGAFPEEVVTALLTVIASFEPYHALAKDRKTFLT